MGPCLHANKPIISSSKPFRSSPELNFSKKILLCTITLSQIGLILSPVPPLACFFCSARMNLSGLNDYHRNNRVQARQKEDRRYTIKFKSCINKICGCHLFTNNCAISFQCNQYLVRVIQLVSMDSAAMARWIFLKR